MLTFTRISCKRLLDFHVSNLGNVLSRALASQVIVASSFQNFFAFVTGIYSNLSDCKTCVLVLGCRGSGGASGKGGYRSVQIEVELQFVQIWYFLRRNSVHWSFNRSSRNSLSRVSCCGAINFQAYKIPVRSSASEEFACKG